MILIPSIDIAKYTEAVVEERQSGRNGQDFRSLCSQWVKRNKYYINNKGNPEIILESRAEYKTIKAAILNLYLSAKTGSVHGDVIVRLRNNTLDVCPFCGDMSRPNTLDHYLPKELFPEYAVHPHNLVPMCSTCQSCKGVQTIDGKGRRLFMHPYFDTFARCQFMKVTIEPPFNAPKDFSIRPNDGLNDDELCLVSRHMTGLEIEARFSKIFAGEYIHILRMARDVREQNGNIINYFKTFRDNYLYRSQNHWLMLLFEHCLKNTPLLEYLETGELPPYL